jgi:hypothetical protein
LTALNLTNFAADGPLPWDHIPENRAFRSSHLAPFSTNIHFQRPSTCFCHIKGFPADPCLVLDCGTAEEPQIRIVVNDGVVPLTSIKGCPAQKDGLCAVSTFVAAMKEQIQNTDWIWACHGDWSVPEGDSWHTTMGSPPQPQ